jgi:hypothetical protein
MSGYNVIVSQNRKSITLRDPTKYDLEVNYQIPAKAIQFTNILLTTSPGYNGIGKTFSLFDGANLYAPINDQQILVGKNNLFLEPTEDYVVSGTSIIFTSAPQSADDIFIIALVTTADLTRTINFFVDNGNSDMESGTKGYLTIDVSGIIDSWKIFSEETGSLRVNILKSNFTSYPTFTTICGTGSTSFRPEVNSSNKAFSDNLVGWTTSILAGEVLRFDVDFSINIKKFLISLKLKL